MAVFIIAVFIIKNIQYAVKYYSAHKKVMHADAVSLCFVDDKAEKTSVSGYIWFKSGSIRKARFNMNQGLVGWFLIR